MRALFAVLLIASCCWCGLTTAQTNCSDAASCETCMHLSQTLGLDGECGWCSTPLEEDGDGKCLYVASDEDPTTRPESCTSHGNEWFYLECRDPCSLIDQTCDYCLAHAPPVGTCGWCMSEDKCISVYSLEVDNCTDWRNTTEEGACDLTFPCDERYQCGECVDGIEGDPYECAWCNGTRECIFASDMQGEGDNATDPLVCYTTAEVCPLSQHTASDGSKPSDHHHGPWLVRRALAWWLSQWRSYAPFADQGVVIDL